LDESAVEVPFLTDSSLFLLQVEGFLHKQILFFSYFANIRAQPLQVSSIEADTSSELEFLGEY
jgi:hypothetical protein